MGREIKRVPFEFDWPIDKVWKGYINPYANMSVGCEHCDDTGSSPQPWTPEDAPVWAFAKRNCERTSDFHGDGQDAIRREAERLCRLWNASWSHHLNADDVSALIEDDRLYDFTHTWTKGEGWQLKNPLVIPTPEQVNAWSLCGFGHDAINCFAVIGAECKRLGCDSQCQHCGGKGYTWPHVQRGDGLTLKQAYENWEEKEPPNGDCYQLWETVSEGSPVSPVFDTPERLARWLVENDDSVTRKTTYEQWLKFICGDGWAPSGVMVNGEYKSGVEAMAEMSETDAAVS